MTIINRGAVLVLLLIKISCASSEKYKNVTHKAVGRTGGFELDELTKKI